MNKAHEHLNIPAPRMGTSSFFMFAEPADLRIAAAGLPDGWKWMCPEPTTPTKDKGDEWLTLQDVGESMDEHKIMQYIVPPRSGEWRNLLQAIRAQHPDAPPIRLHFWCEETSMFFLESHPVHGARIVVAEYKEFFKEKRRSINCFASNGGCTYDSRVPADLAEAWRANKPYAPPITAWHNHYTGGGDEYDARDVLDVTAYRAAVRAWEGTGAGLRVLVWSDVCDNFVDQARLAEAEAAAVAHSCAMVHGLRALGLL